MWQKAIEVYKSLKTKKEVVQPYTNCQNEVLLACAKSGRGLEALALYEDARKTNKQMSASRRLDLGGSSWPVNEATCGRKILN